MTQCRQIAVRPAQPLKFAALWRMGAFVVVCGCALPAWPNPQGMTVAGGKVSASQNGPQLTIQASHNAVINWQSFNIQSGETTTFLQPSSRSVVWNRIFDANPSQIWGSLNANGTVVLMNQNGFYFGPNSSVNVGGFIAASAAVLPPPAVGGSLWSYQGPPPSAKIINFGQITAHDGGSVFLIAEGIENHGVVSAPDGKLGLYAGKQVLVSERPDGRGLSALVQLPEGSVNNSGQLIADAGTIALHARVVNQNGVVQANTVRERAGVIELVASEAVNLGPDSVLRANGDTAGSGGQLTIKSAQSFSDAPGSLIEIRGGAQGGSGGVAEISAPIMPSIESQIDGTAVAGTGGRLVIDPLDIVIGRSGTGSAGSGTVGSDTLPNTTLSLSVSSAFRGLSQIDLQATRNISLAANTTWDLVQSTGLSGPGCQLALEAGNNITFNSNAKLLAGPGWTVSLLAGRDFSSPTAVKPNTGTILLQPGSALQTQDGALNLLAGKDVSLYSGLVSTLAGGNISISALSGNINLGNVASSSGGISWNLPASALAGVSSPHLSLEAGNNILFANNSTLAADAGWSVSLAAGVDFSSPTHAVRSGTGGIYLNGGPANASGSRPVNTGAIQTSDGDLSLQAGHEVLLAGGYLRTVNGGNIAITTGDGAVDAGTKTDTYEFTSEGYALSSLGLGGIGTAGGGNVTIHAGGDILSTSAQIGAFGAAPGNVTLSAADDIKGSFMVRNGVGTLQAAHNIGESSSTVSLGLVNGGWNLSATDIYLNEVFNPNGALNPNRASFGPRVTFQFDYSPTAFVNLVASHGVVLAGDNLAHTSDNPSRPAIYAPILNISAGSGGVWLGNDVILYPSAQGSLSIQTLAGSGGSLGSLPGHFAQLIVSDSGSADYRAFATDHAATPLHLGQTGAGIHMHIDGDLKNLFLRSPEQADISIGGDAINFAFEGQQFSGSDQTHIDIQGNYISYLDRASVTLNTVPNLGFLTDPLLSANPTLGARLSYNPRTHELTILNPMTEADLAFLLHPVSYVLDPNTGEPKVDAQGNLVTVPIKLAANSEALATALNQLYTDSQNIPVASQARFGVQVGGPGLLDFRAHDLDLGISGGIRSVGPLLNPALARVSSQGANVRIELAGDLKMTSSQIASFNGGDISLVSQGMLDIGSQQSFTSDETPKGIYTGHGGSVFVQAAGDISIQGSRIASYDGGDITVISQHGSVDAGAGAKGFFSVTTSQFNPATQQVETRNDQFFGSGIMALTRTDSRAQVGNITVQAAGDIRANSGGILQLAFNQQNQSQARVSLEAGGSILARNSGVLGRNVDLKAGGDIEGLVVAAQDVAITAQQSVSVTALAGGSASVSAGTSLSGSIVGGGNVNVSGSEVSASVISTGGSTSTSGNASGATMGAFTSVAAPTAQKTTEAADKTIAAQASAQADDPEETKRKHATGKSPTLVRRTGRVTVLLPQN